MKKYLFLLPLFLQLLNADENFDDISLKDIMEIEIDPVVSVDSHGVEGDYFDSKSAVDVIYAQQIEHSGLTSLTDVLRYFVAGFNAPETSLADGSDHVRAFTLRGMSADQVLVLLNGKRLHTSALLHVNTTIGRGSNNVDLDTIPIYAIKKIEILRDGAAAQYGSDAIAGVINIILKSHGDKSTVSMQGGKRYNGDGERANLSAFVNIPLKYDGFVNFTASTTKSNQTQHAGDDRRLTPPKVITHYGLPDADSYQFLLNSELPFENGVALYSNILLNKKQSEASAFFRTPDKNRAFNRDGFLPMIHADIDDYSLNVGIKGLMFYGVEWDLSQVVGANSFTFNVDDSMNYSLGKSSPTSFYNGKLFTQESTTNLDFKKHFESDFTLSAGAEYRNEKYSISKGDKASYSGTASEGLKGFQPRNEVDASRYSYATYLDGVWSLSSKLSTELAARYENYSDFGEMSNVKFALSYKILKPLSLRTSASIGFRAPSLAQSNYSLTSSYVDTNGTIFTKGTFKTDDSEAISEGATSLKPEKSKHLSIGTLYKTDDFYFTMDYFYIKVNDKIMLSDDIDVSSGNIDKVRFFTNAVDTRTQGVDLKTAYNKKFKNSQKLDVSFWYHYSINRITHINTPHISKKNSLEQLDTIENGQPKDSQRVLLNYNVNSYNVALNISRFGSFSQIISEKSRFFDPIISTDLELTYSFKKYLALSLGGTNIFNSMPNKWKDLSGIGLGYDGIVPYSEYSPLGFSGAFYYVKATLKF